MTSNIEISGTGLSGLVFSRVSELLGSTYAFTPLTLNGEHVDVTDEAAVFKAIESSSASIVLHAAAVTDVKGAEKEKDLGKESMAWKVNVVGTENIAKACQRTGKKIIYISTDLVFGGDDTPEGGYTEDNIENPKNWYATTKYEGELRVRDLHTPWIIMRLAYPYRASFVKPDFVRFFLQWLREHKSISVLTDRIITPTFIDDLAPALDSLIQSHATGIYHTVGSESLSIYDAVISIADVFGLDKQLIGKITRAEFLVGRPPEPFNSSLNSGKIEKLGVKMNGFGEGLKIIKKQMG